VLCFSIFASLEKTKVATAMTRFENRDEVVSPEFFENAEAVELPEASWQDAEDSVPETQEETAAPAQEKEESEEHQPSASGLNQREWRARNQRYADLDEQLDSVVAVDDGPFTLSPFMAKELKAFRTVVSSYLNERHKSNVKVMNYSGAGHGTRQAYKPTQLDFMCDVELVSKKALKCSPQMLKDFQKHILMNEGKTWKEVSMYVRGKIEKHVGQAFEKAGLFPIGRYFNS
jgi:hypothetical protein